MTAILSIAVPILFACVPTIIWLAFFLREDPHREPTRLLVKTFLYGAFMSMPALFIQVLCERFVSGGEWMLIITMFLYAAIEEVCKWWGAYAVVRRAPDFDEPVDSMIYMIVAGLGFATVENIFVLSVFFGASNAHEFAGVGQALLMRLIGATLLHVLASALIGFYWARGVAENQGRRGWLRGLAVAAIVHGAFNVLVFFTQNTSPLIPSILLIGVTFFVLNDFESLRKIGDREV